MSLCVERITVFFYSIRTRRQKHPINLSSIVYILFHPSIRRRLRSCAFSSLFSPHIFRECHSLLSSPSLRACSRAAFSNRPEI
eukprot:g3623.t1